VIVKKYRQRHTQRRKPKALDLFSGWRGLTLGLKQAGFRVLGGVEIEAKAASTYRLNHRDVRVFEADIRSLSATKMRTKLGIRRGALDLIAGCPPCQGFSRIRTRNKANSVLDQRNDLVSEFLRFVRVFLPKAVMLENVPALSKHRRLKRMVSVLRRLGYQCHVNVLDASDFGVPQRRKRMILLASRFGTPREARKAKKLRTVRDAFSTLSRDFERRDRLHLLPEARSARVQQIIAAIPKDGGSRSELPKKLRLKCHRRLDGFRDVYGRMAWNAVAPTITSGCSNPSKGRFVHPSKNRTITLREAALLQGFPHSYKFDVTHGKEALALMIGNALPPPFIKAQARTLIAASRS